MRLYLEPPALLNNVSIRISFYGGWCGWSEIITRHDFHLPEQ